MDGVSGIALGVAARTYSQLSSSRLLVTTHCGYVSLPSLGNDHDVCGSDRLGNVASTSRRKRTTGGCSRSAVGVAACTYNHVIRRFGPATTHVGRVSPAPYILNR